MEKKIADNLKESNSELIEQYEALRSSVAGSQTNSSQKGYNGFLQQGMLGWLVETVTHKPAKIKPSPLEENHLRSLYHTLITQAVTDILIKKIRVKRC